MENNTVFKFVVMVAALLALLFVAIQLSKNPVSKEADQQEEAAKPAEIEQVSQDTLPNKFPEDLPSEPGAKITQNFNATESDGRYNATRQFETKNSLAANLTLYTNYLKKNDWEILATLDQPNLKMVMGQKGKQQLQASFAVDPTTNTNLVTLSLTEFK